MKKHSQYVLRPGTGRTIPQAQIRVRAYPSVDADPTVTVYSDSDGLDPLAQPFLASAAGKVEFYVPDGRYDIYVVYETISYVDRDIWIYEPSSVGGSGDVQGAKVVIAEADPALPNGLVIPTFLAHPDIPPSVPGAIDDEFSTLSGWTNFNHTADTTVSVVNHRLRVQHITNPLGYPTGVSKAFTEPASYKLTALVRIGYHPGLSFGDTSGERPAFGLALRTNLGEVMLFSIRGGPQEISVCQLNYDVSSLISTDMFHNIGTNAAYLQLEKSGSDYLLRWSVDGITWVFAKKFSIASVFSGTVTDVGLLAFPTFIAPDGFVDCYADFIRIT